MISGSGGKSKSKMKPMSARIGLITSGCGSVWRQGLEGNGIFPEGGTLLR